jgi:hypothetical protein
VITGRAAKNRFQAGLAIVQTHSVVAVELPRGAIVEIERMAQIKAPFL